MTGQMFLHRDGGCKHDMTNFENTQSHTMPTVMPPIINDKGQDKEEIMDNLEEKRGRHGGEELQALCRTKPQIPPVLFMQLGIYSVE